MKEAVSGEVEDKGRIGMSYKVRRLVYLLSGMIVLCLEFQVGALRPC